MDPLIQQMNDSLGLAARPVSQQLRQRRFSDGGRHRPTSNSSTGPDLDSVRSSNKSKWPWMSDKQTSTKELADPAPKPAGNLQSDSPPQHECSSVSCSVAKVFQTPELLELILSFVDTQDIITLRTTCKMWNGIMKTSPQLRFHYFVIPQWNRNPINFQLLDFNLNGLSIKLGESLETGFWIYVTMDAQAARKICPNFKPTGRVRSRSIFEGLRGGLGSRSQRDSDTWPGHKKPEFKSPRLSLEDILVVQPPITSMLASYVPTNDGPLEQLDDHGSDPEIPPCAKLFCDTGITLEFLADSALSLLAPKKSQPSCGAATEITFRAIISFYRWPQEYRERSHKRILTPLW